MNPDNKSRLFFEFNKDLEDRVVDDFRLKGTFPGCPQRETPAAGQSGDPADLPAGLSRSFRTAPKGQRGVGHSVSGAQGHPASRGRHRARSGLGGKGSNTFSKAPSRERARGKGGNTHSKERARGKGSNTLSKERAGGKGSNTLSKERARRKGGKPSARSGLGARGAIPSARSGLGGKGGNPQQGTAKGKPPPVPALTKRLRHRPGAPAGGTPNPERPARTGRRPQHRHHPRERAATPASPRPPPEGCRLGYPAANPSPRTLPPAARTLRSGFTLVPGARRRRLTPPALAPRAPPGPGRSRLRLRPDCGARRQVTARSTARPPARTPRARPAPPLDAALAADAQPPTRPRMRSFAE
ncbi:collagen alpha-1(III) chain-like [Ammospiza nelsoni]|uniref:collagen alpha-1(III) chain-like n=1 Tax=Ammospiza nelsoni TaxID=2857394 RepID=UPI002869D5BE|nr:collagen alpha-1(III) chain-like [Ammospiza nelsoni]